MLIKSIIVDQLPKKCEECICIKCKKQERVCDGCNYCVHEGCDSCDEFEELQMDKR